MEGGSTMSSQFPGRSSNSHNVRRVQAYRRARVAGPPRWQAPRLSSSLVDPSATDSVVAQIRAPSGHRPLHSGGHLQDGHLRGRPRRAVPQSGRPKSSPSPAAAAASAQASQTDPAEGQTERSAGGVVAFGHFVCCRLLQSDVDFWAAWNAGRLFREHRLALLPQNWALEESSRIHGYLKLAFDCCIYNMYVFVTSYN